MNEVLQTTFAYGITIGAMLVGMVVIVLSIGLLLTCPRPLMFGFIACMAVFASSSTYGLAEGAETNVFWVKGTRTFFFSFIEMGLWGAWLALLFRQAWDHSTRPGATHAALPTSKYYAAIGLLLAGQVLLGLTEADRNWMLDVSLRGYSGLLYQGIFIALVVHVLRTEQDIRRVILILMVALGCRHVFGLVRYLVLGGDPQNAYAELGTSKVKITFWDINDSIFAAVMFALCVWQMLEVQLASAGRRLLLASGATLALLIPLLSARRTAQFGMLLALLALTFFLKGRKRMIGVIALLAAVPLMLAALTMRSDSTRASVLDKVMIDVKTNAFSDPRKSRFHELFTAWDTIQESPVFGLGPSGRYRVLDTTGLEYHKGNFDFVHSGFGHMLLKSGFVGLGLMLATLIAWALYLRHHWHHLHGASKTIAVASLCGFAASVPNLLFGTPITEMRTVLTGGLLMALPMAAARLCASVPVPQPQDVRASRASEHTASPSPNTPPFFGHA